MTGKTQIQLAPNVVAQTYLYDDYEDGGVWWYTISFPDGDDVDMDPHGPFADEDEAIAAARAEDVPTQLAELADFVALRDENIESWRAEFRRRYGMAIT